MLNVAQLIAIVLFTVFRFTYVRKRYNDSALLPFITIALFTVLILLLGISTIFLGEDKPSELSIGLLLLTWIFYTILIFKDIISYTIKENKFRRELETSEFKTYELAKDQKLAPVYYAGIVLSIYLFSQVLFNDNEYFTTFTRIYLLLMSITGLSISIYRLRRARKTRSPNEIS